MSTLTVTRRGPHAGDGSAGVQRHPVPGDAGRSRASRSSAPSTRCSASSRWRSRRCSRTSRSRSTGFRATRAPTSRTSTSSPRRSATCSTSSPARCPGMNMAYWGPEIKVGVPQPALNINMDAHTNVESLTFSINHSEKEMPVVFVQTRRCSRSPIPIPIPDVNPLQPPLGAVPPFPKKFDAHEGHGAACRRSRRSGAASPAPPARPTSVDRQRLARRPALRPAAEGARPGRRARRGHGLRRPLLRQERHRTLKRGEFKQSFTLARNALVSITPRVPGMSAASKFYGKYRGTVINNVDPMQIGRVQVQCAGRARPGDLELGDAVRAGRRHAQRRLLRVPQIGAGVWVEFEHGDPDYPDLGRAASGAPGRACRRWRSRRRRRRPTSSSRRPGRTRSPSWAHRARATTGGILIADRRPARCIVVNDVGIIIPNGKGATITMAGPIVDDQQRRA